MSKSGGAGAKLTWSSVAVSLLCSCCTCSASTGLTGSQMSDSTVANVTLLFAEHHSVDCVQIIVPQMLSQRQRNRLHGVFKALTSVEPRTTIGVYSFLEYVNRKKKKSLKVSCYKPLKVVFEDEGSKQELSYLSKEIPVQGSVWLLFLEASFPDFLEPVNLPFDVELVVALATSPDIVHFLEAYRVKPEMPLRIRDYGKWTPLVGLDMPASFVFTRRFDLEGIVLRTGSIENWPTTYSSAKGWDGYFLRVWREVERLVNCSSVNLGSVDGTTGSVNVDGTWNGLVGMALRGEIDVIVSELTIDKPRSRVLEYFHPLLKSSYQVYYHHQGYNLEWTSLFKPFGRAVWTCIVLWLLTGTVALSICYYVSLMCGFEDDNEVSFGFVRSFFFILQSLCQQGHYVTPRSTACKILFFTAYLVSAVLIPSYSASLISSLTQQTPYRPFDSLEEMLDDGTYRLLVKNNTAERAYFQASNSKLLQDVYRKLILTVPREHEMVDTRQALYHVCHLPRYALFGIEAVNSIRVATVLKPDCPVMTLSRPLTTVYLTMGLVKGHPYSGLINHQIHKLVDSGITKRIELDVWPRKHLAAPDPDTQVQPEEVFQIFVLTGFFIFVSLTMLFGERTWHERQRKNPPRHESSFLTQKA